jgi:septal ring factor EnvC (AmiA/AmiB activator)
VSTGGPYQPTGEFDPDQQPATAGDVRGLRRWIVVTAIWAVAASVIALVALFGVTPADESAKDVDAAQVADLTRQLDELDAKVSKATGDASDAADTASGLSSSIDDATSTAAEAQSTADKTASQLNDLQSQVDELEDRLSSLEDAGQPPIDAEPGNGDSDGGF